MLPRVMRAMALAGRPPHHHAQQQMQQEQEEQQPPTITYSQHTNSAPPAPAVIYYAHTKHRYDICDVLFAEQCAAAGLRMEEVHEPGAPAPPPSPPPLTELFPDMRCAVFNITVADS